MKYEYQVVGNMREVENLGLEGWKMVWVLIKRDENVYIMEREMNKFNVVMKPI